MIWREKRVWLVVLSLFLAADIFVFVTYRVQFQRRIEDVEARKTQAENRLDSQRRARQTAEQTFARYRKVQAELDTLYNTRWATENERFIPLINEVKRLAVASQLVPRSYNFTRLDEKDPAAKTKAGIGTTVVSITYSVQGNYQQVRRLINLLELSEQFVIIDSLSVATSGGDLNLLTMNLRLKTLFREPRRVQTSPTAAVDAPANQVM